MLYLEGPSFTATDYPADAGDTAGDDLVELIAARMAAAPGLRVVLALSKELDYGPGYETFAAREYARRLEAVSRLKAVDAERVVAFHPIGFPGRPLRLMTPVLVVDDLWAMVGSSTFRRRGLAFDGGLDLALFDTQLREGRGVAIADLRRRLTAGHLNVGPPAAGAVPHPTWVQLADAHSAFAACKSLLDQGGAGLIEPIWDGRVPGRPVIGGDSFPGDDVADPDGRAFNSVVALILAARILPADEPRPTERFDALGLALLSPGLALVIYGLAESSSQGGFGDARVLVPVAIGFALLALFVRHGLRFPHPVIDLHLFRNRVFSAATATLTVFALAVFGGMLLLPLYLQAVRGESALTSGLLLAPQGIGAMITMPIAGQLTDRIGIAKIVLPGIALIIASFVALTQIGAETSYWVLGAELFVMGLGMGLAMMPVFSGAMQTLRRAAVARASTSLNILQQVGASIGTAVMAVLLASALSSRLPQGGGEGLGATEVPDEARRQIAPLMADAFGEVFWWATGFLVVAFLIATLLPKEKPEPVFDPDDPEAGEQEPVPMMIG
jgi:MFS family permease